MSVIILGSIISSVWTSFVRITFITCLEVMLQSPPLYFLYNIWILIVAEIYLLDPINIVNKQSMYIRIDFYSDLFAESYTEKNLWYFA